MQDKKLKPRESRSSSENYAAGQNAREWGARNLKRHYEKQGKDVSYEQCRKEFNTRADKVDREKGW